MSILIDFAGVLILEGSSSSHPAAVGVTLHLTLMLGVHLFSAWQKVLGFRLHISSVTVEEPCLSQIH